MADSIFNRPMFAAGQYADPVTPKKGAPTEQVKFVRHRRVLLRPCLIYLERQ